MICDYHYHYDHEIKLKYQYDKVILNMSYKYYIQSNWYW